MIYADTSALVKLITDEPETAALFRWFAALDEPVATNSVGAVELRRVAARIDAIAVDAATLILMRIDQLDVIDSTYSLASRVPPVSLRSLDALHLASAIRAQDVTALLTYDARMAEAAALAGLPVVAPA